MPSRKIHPRVFVAAILLTVVSAFGVVSVRQVWGTTSKQNPSPTPSIPISDFAMPFYVSNLLVETNLDSSQPLVVHVHGGLADSCTRIRYGIVHYNESDIRILLYMGFRNQFAACAGMIYPITVSIPLDVAALAPGDYTLNVMGQTQTITITPEMQAAAVAFDTATTGLDIESLEYIPVSDIEDQPAVQIRGHYTIDCPYIIGVVQQTEGNRITLIPRAASVESELIPDTDCRQNHYDLPEPMPLVIPLDLADLPLGEDTLTVGDKSLKFDLDAAPVPPRIIPADWMTPMTEPPADSLWLPVN